MGFPLLTLLMEGFQITAPLPPPTTTLVDPTPSENSPSPVREESPPPSSPAPSTSSLLSMPVSPHQSDWEGSRGPALSAPSALSAPALLPQSDDEWDDEGGHEECKYGSFSPPRPRNRSDASSPPFSPPNSPTRQISRFLDPPSSSLTYFCPTGPRYILILFPQLAAWGATDVEHHRPHAAYQ